LLALPTLFTDSPLIRLWRDVTYSLKHNDVEAATAAKHKLEQRQREEAKERKESGVPWETKVRKPPVLTMSLIFFSRSISMKWVSTGCTTTQSSSAKDVP
jgi:hypothetical protein